MQQPLTNISGSWTVQRYTIKSDYWRKLIPSRKWDWEVWIDETADLGMKVGYGPTYLDAVRDLLGQEAEVD